MGGPPTWQGSFGVPTKATQKRYPQNKNTPKKKERVDLAVADLSLKPLPRCLVGLTSSKAEGL